MVVPDRTRLIAGFGFLTSIKRVKPISYGWLSDELTLICATRVVHRLKGPQMHACRHLPTRLSKIIEKGAVSL
jgi:hypothetical protein